MSIAVEVLTPEREDAYEAFVSSHSEALVVQSLRFRNLLTAILGCGSHYLVAADGGTVVGALPLLYADGPMGRVYNSLPFYGSPAGLLTDDACARAQLADAYNDLVVSEGTLASTVIASPFHARSGEGLVHSDADSRIGQYTPLDLQGDPWEAFLGRVESSGRRNIRSAIAHGIEVRTDPDALDFLAQTHQANIRAVGGQAKTDSFFQLVPRHFTAGEDYDVFVAEGAPGRLAALLVFYFAGTAEYFTPATVEEHRTLQAMPLLIAHAIVAAAARGCQRWNWGGTWESQTGVYRFKRKWGAEELPYRYLTQLNDRSILRCTADELLAAYPHFFVVPFSQLDARTRP